jgi:hypothetical protein
MYDNDEDMNIAGSCEPDRKGVKMKLMDELMEYSNGLMAQQLKHKYVSPTDAGVVEETETLVKKENIDPNFMVDNLSSEDLERMLAESEGVGKLIKKGV